MGISSYVLTYRVILHDVCVSSIASFIPANVGRPLSAHNLRFVVCMDEKCSYYTHASNILRKNANIALIYVNTNLFTLLHFYMFQRSKGQSLGSTDTFREQV